MYSVRTSSLVAWKIARDGIVTVLVRLPRGSRQACSLCPDDRGVSRFSKQMGNDLSTPVPAYDFPGLKPGDCWCLCAARWQEAFEAGMAPKVKLEACEESALEIVQLSDLQAHAQAF